MNYIYGGNTFYEYTPDTSNELTHYGVKGMKWGVRRNTKRLNSSDSATRAKAAGSLQKHREKASNEIAKLKKSNVKLDKRASDNIAKLEPKIAKLERKSAKLKLKAGKAFYTSTSSKRLHKSAKLDLKVAKLKESAAKTKAKIEKNQSMIKMFEKGISDIDSAMATRGEEYVKAKD